MSVLLDVIPVELLDKDRQEDVIALIRELPLDPEDKKRLINEWCIYVGAVLTREKVEEVGGR